MNKFLEHIQQTPTGQTENGALAYTDTCSNLLNYFSNCNNFYRSYSDVELDLNKCWYENKDLTLKLIGYIRAISRTDNTTQFKVKGLGLKHEGRLCLKWLYLNHPKVFYTNLNTFINLGSWADLWHRDLQDWMVNKDIIIINFISNYLLTYNDDLCLKYLPRHKTISNIKRRNPGKETLNFHLLRNKMLQLLSNNLSNRTGVTFTVRDLMNWKVKGGAHSWQQLISNKKYTDINFDKLPGKVLQWITKEKEGESFLSRHNLEERYINWLDTKETINNTSYIYELVKPAVEAYETYSGITLSKVQKYTIEKQINNILKSAEESELNVMPVLDTSGSMCVSVHKNVSALHICLSLGIYFSMLQKGSFKDYVIAFDDDSKLIRLAGSYLDRLKDVLSRQSFMGSTNFQSVIDLIIKTRVSKPNIPIEDYPQVYLVISDMQMNETTYDSYGNIKTTNHQEAIRKFDEVGLPQPLFIWYNVSPYGNDNFQNHKDDSGVIHMSGFDPSAINRLMSKEFQLKFEEQHNKSINEITPFEAMLETLNQEYLSVLTI
jgi:hypothetical protein